MTADRPDSASMRASAYTGGRWGAIRSLILQVVSIGTTAVLARLLSTEEFGIVAITVVVLAMFDLITRVGLGATIIRRNPLTEDVKSTFFWASLTLGGFAGALAAFASGPAASLAGSAEAAPLVALAALMLPLNLASKVPTGLLSRAFRFRTLATIDIAGTLAHTLVAISLALAGFGAVSVVVGQIIRSATTLVGSFMASGFRPRLAFDRAVISEELAFNVGWLSADLVAYANKNLDYWYVGNVLGTGPLGIYYVAYVLPTLLRSRVTTIGHEVIYPVVARIQEERDRVRAAYLRVVRLVTSIVVPAMLGLAVVADLVVRIGFGTEWLQATGPLRVISIAAAITSMTVVANPLFAALGRPGILVANGLIALATLMLALALGASRDSLVAVAFAVLAAAIAEGVVSLVRLRSVIGLTVGAFVSAVGPYVISAIIMAGTVIAFRQIIADNLGVIAQSVVLVTIGALVYPGVGFLIFRRAFRDQLTALRALLFPTRSATRMKEGSTLAAVDDDPRTGND